MTRIIETPDPEILSKWGALAYVSEEERRAILNSAFGQFKPAVKRLEKEIKEMQKAKKKREEAEAFKRATQLQR